MTIQARDLGAFAERSRVLVSTGASPVSRDADGLLRASSDVFYLQPNDGSLAPREAKGVVLRRWVEFPRRGTLIAIPVETVGSDVLDLYPEGPPILAEEMIPMGAGWLSPLKATLFAGLMAVAGFAFVKRQKARK